MFDLQVRGLPFFEEVDWHIPNGLVAITGETGAGKSLLIGTLRWVLGGPPPSEGYLEATLTLPSSPSIRGWLGDYGFPLEDFLILRRVWDPQRRRGRIWIQDTPATLRTLRNLTQRLALFHEQQDRLVEDEPLLLTLIDRYAKAIPLRKEVQKAFHQWQELRKQLEALHREAQEQVIREEILKHEREELQTLPEPQEWEELHRTLQRIEYGERLRDVVRQLQGIVDQILEGVGELYQTIRSSQDLDPDLANLLPKVSDVESLLKDLYREVDAYDANLDIDEEERAHLASLRDRVNRLMLRYHTDFHGLVDIRQKVESEWEQLQTLESRLHQTETQEKQAYQTYHHLAQTLHEKRSKILPRLTHHILNLLDILRLSGASLRFDLQIGSPRPEGIDVLRVLFNAHGEATERVSQVASGGERARLNLAFLAAFSEEMDIPLIVLDEIDAAVGGDTAHHVGEILEKLSQDENRTVLVVTHWPQVAARAHIHDRVVKTQKDDGVFMTLERLEGHARVIELARMLGNPSDTLLREAAQDLLQTRQRQS